LNMFGGSTQWSSTLIRIMSSLFMAGFPLLEIHRESVGRVPPRGRRAATRALLPINENYLLAK
jgi:hypothetical protein